MIAHAEPILRVGNDDDDDGGKNTSARSQASPIDRVTIKVREREGTQCSTLLDCSREKKNTTLTDTHHLFDDEIRTRDKRLWR